MTSILKVDAITGQSDTTEINSPITLSGNTATLGSTVIMTQGSDATGDIYYRAADGTLTRLAAGAADTVLTSSGAGAVPAFKHQYNYDRPGDGHYDIDRYTQVLIVSDYLDSSTIIQNSARKDKEVTISGAIHHDTTQAKIGQSSMYFDSNDDYLSIPGTAKNQTTGPFTVDFWMWTADTGASAVFDFRASGTTHLYMDHTSTSEIQYCIGGSTCVKIAPTGGVSDSAWHHVAICRDSTTWYFFWDGVAQTTPTTGSLTANLTTDICGTTALRLGENYPSSAGYKDYIDEFRLSVGICPWTSNFTIY